MSDDLSIDPNSLIIKGFMEAITYINDRFPHVKIRLLREFDTKSALSHRDKDELMALYSGMLRNRQIKSHVEDMDSIEAIQESLDSWSADGGRTEQIFVIADFKGEIVSFIYGGLVGNVFFLWYLVGPKNLTFTSKAKKRDVPDNLESPQYTEVLVTKLLAHLYSHRNVDYIVFAVSSDGLNNPKGMERSRLRLFKQVESSILAKNKGFAEMYPIN